MRPGVTRHVYRAELLIGPFTRMGHFSGLSPEEKARRRRRSWLAKQSRRRNR